MNHPENDEKYKGLKVNSGTSYAPTVSPYLTARRPRRFTTTEFV